jgi:hypothetical protein
MATTFAFSGGSDDLIEIDVDGDADEINVYGRGPIMWTADITDPDTGHSLRVQAVLAECWSFALGQTDEDHPFPAWPVRFSQEPSCSYSVRVEIDAPAGATLTHDGKS